MAKAVAAILVNYKTPKLTADCISSLLQYCDNQLFDVIVVDNASADGSVKQLRSQFPAVIYFENEENLGFAEGNNVGLRYSIHAGYTYSLIINTDTLVDEDVITKLKSHLDRDPQLGAVQPAIYWMHNRTNIWNGPCYFNRLTGNIYSQKNTTETATKVDWVTGCCMLVKNEALVKAGLFNKQFFLYYEDVELSLRMRQHGFQLQYTPECKMYHEAGQSGKSKTKQHEGFLNPLIHYYVSRNHIWVLRRYGIKVLFPVYFIWNGAYYLALLAYFLLRGRKNKFSQLMKGLKEGLFTSQSVIWPDC